MLAEGPRFTQFLLGRRNDPIKFEGQCGVERFDLVFRQEIMRSLTRSISPGMATSGFPGRPSLAGPDRARRP